MILTCSIGSKSVFLDIVLESAMGVPKVKTAVEKCIYTKDFQKNKKFCHWLKRVFFNALHISNTMDGSQDDSLGSDNVAECRDGPMEMQHHMEQLMMTRTVTMTMMQICFMLMKMSEPFQQLKKLINCLIRITTTKNFVDFY